MTTSGRNKRRAGFTLLEMMAVMAIMVLMLGIAGFAMRQAAPEYSVKKPRNELVRIAKLAVRASAINGYGHYIAFDKQGFALVGSQDRQRDRVNLPKGMKVAIKRWGTADWEAAEGQRWAFGSQGLCEPISIRLMAEDSSLMMRFNPLTGTPVEEEMEAYQ